jgi:ammonia channel protein AmtB
MASIIGWFTSDDGARAIAGLAGASVSAALEWHGLMPATRKVFIGTLSAYYLGPIASPVFEWAMSGLKVNPGVGVSGFLMGLVGITVAEIVVKAFRLKRDQLGGSE